MLTSCFTYSAFFTSTTCVSCLRLLLFSVSINCFLYSLYTKNSLILVQNCNVFFCLVCCYQKKAHFFRLSCCQLTRKIYL